MEKKKDEYLSSQLAEEIQKTEHLNIIPKRENTVRTSFKLTNSTMQMFDKIKDFHGLSTKELLDIINDFYRNNNEILTTIFKIIRDTAKTSIFSGTVKTLAISNKAKMYLEGLSSKEKISRDTLLDYLITGFHIRFQQLMAKHEKALMIIRDYNTAKSKVGSQLSKILPKNDPILDRVDLILSAWQELETAVESELNDNVPIDTRDIWQNC